MRKIRVAADISSLYKVSGMRSNGLLLRKSLNAFQALLNLTVGNSIKHFVIFFYHH